MNVQTLIPFTPFLAILFVLVALIQALRRRQQGVGSALIALIAVGVPIAAYVLTDDALVKVSLIEYMAINAAIVFIASIIVLLLERRNPNRDLNHSYGMLGIGVSVLLALGIFLTPALARALGTSGANGTPVANNSGFQGFGSRGALSTESAPEGTASAQSETQVAQVLTAQTGLSTSDLTTQLSSGSTIAQLVSAHNGDLSAVTSAISAGLDQLSASGGAQLISRLGSDSATIASQLVQGTLPGQAQQFVLTALINGSLPSFGGSGGSGFGGNRTAQSTAEATVAPGGGGFGGFGGNRTAQSTAEPTAPASGGFGGFGGFGGSHTATQTPSAASPAATATAPASGGFGSFLAGLLGGGNRTAQPTVAARGTEQVIAPTNTPENLSGTTPEATAQAETQVAQVLSAQTGLSVADLTTQLNGGSTIAQLVSAHNGDLNAVTTAITSALDQLTASGGGQLLSRLGDSATVAGEVVQGTLPGRTQQLVVTALITGTVPSFGGAGGTGGFGGGATQAAPQGTPTVAPTPTPTVARPTRIVFPTWTPTPIGTEEATAEATGSVAPNPNACTLITEYDLNMRDKPNKDTGVVLLSIPTGTTVTPTSRTQDGWYSVTYQGHSGWVDGSYAVVGATCSSLPAATGQ